MYAQGGSNYIGLLAIRSARSYGWQLREITAGFPSKKCISARMKVAGPH